MHYINRDKGKLYNQWLLFYKMDTFIKKKVLMNIGYSLGHCYKKFFLTNIGYYLGHFYKKNFLQI